MILDVNLLLYIFVMHLALFGAARILNREGDFSATCDSNASQCSLGAEYPSCIHSSRFPCFRDYITNISIFGWGVTNFGLQKNIKLLSILQPQINVFSCLLGLHFEICYFSRFFQII